MCIEKDISAFMLRFSKFEFYLINEFKDLIEFSSHSDSYNHKITGLDWNKLASKLEERFPFAGLDKTSFNNLINQRPQFLVITQNKKLKWDSDPSPISCWHGLLTKSLAQLRNNIAHGNKAHLTAPFTHGRTKAFIKEANELIDFIIKTLTSRDSLWEEDITFHN